jgi:hypothetical protein
MLNRYKTKITIGILLTLILTLGLFVLPALACGNCDDPGVGSPGYWMNHPEAWPVDSIQIGNDGFTKAEAIALMKAPTKKDKTHTMFQALVAARLNLLIGNRCFCSPANPFALVGEAQDWFQHYPVGSGILASSEAWQYSHGESIYWRLDAYNNGLLCAPARD